MSIRDLRRNEPLASKTSMGVGGSAAVYCAIGDPDCPFTSDKTTGLSLSAAAVGSKGHAEAAAADAAAIGLALGHAARERLAACVLGGGTNVVFADGALPLLVLQQHRAMLSRSDLSLGRVRWVASAGLSFDALVAAATQDGLAGLECLSGIPGSVGAAPVQNIGAYGQSLADVLEGVWAVPSAGGPAQFLPAAALGLGYRTSVLRRSPGAFIVTDVAFVLGRKAGRVHHPQIKAALAERGLGGEGASPVAPSDVRAAVLAVRGAKGMLWPASGPSQTPGNAGSFFLNPTVSAAEAEALGQRWPELPRYPGEKGVRLAAGWLIEAAGLKRGHVFAEAEGRVGLSPQHALALINRGQATGRDVQRSASVVTDRVSAVFGLRLVAEACLLGFAAPLL